MVCENGLPLTKYLFAENVRTKRIYISKLRASVSFAIKCLISRLWFHNIYNNNYTPSEQGIHSLGFIICISRSWYLSFDQMPHFYQALCSSKFGFCPSFLKWSYDAVWLNGESRKLKVGPLEEKMCTCFKNLIDQYFPICLY